VTIIDAQVHIWKPETPERPYVKEDASKPHRPVPFGYEDLLREMSAAGVDRVILVPPSWEGYRNDYALEAAQTYPDRFAVMGKVPLNDAASKARIATWLKQPGMLGFASASGTAAPIRFLMTARRTGFGRTVNAMTFPS
jgi:predicted TIM-barrel fold metal-dependent hydrolase